MLILAALLAGACAGDPGPDDDVRDASSTVTAAFEAHADGDLDAAIELYEQVLELDPRNTLASCNLGLIAQTRGLEEEAAARYQEALAADPAFTPAPFNLTIVRAEQGDARGAIRLHREVLAANTADGAAHLILGFLLIQTGRKHEGRRNCTSP